MTAPLTDPKGEGGGMAKPTHWGEPCPDCKWSLTSWCMTCGAPLCITKGCPRVTWRCHPEQS